MAARSVLDAGCGNEYHLSRLKTHFPDKAFTGLDRSPEPIAQARSRYGARGLRFEFGDFMGDAPPGSYDALLMRFMLQHMKDVGGVLARAASAVDRRVQDLERLALSLRSRASGGAQMGSVERGEQPARLTVLRVATGARRADAAPLLGGTAASGQPGFTSLQAAVIGFQRLFLLAIRYAWSGHDGLQ